MLRIKPKLALQEVRDLMDRDEQVKLMDDSNNLELPEDENLELISEDDLEEASRPARAWRSRTTTSRGPGKKRKGSSARKHLLTDDAPAVVKRQSGPCSCDLRDTNRLVDADALAILAYGERPRATPRRSRHGWAITP